MPDLEMAHEHVKFINQAIARLAPRWTTWTLQTIQQRGPLRVANISSALPWIGIQNTAQVVRRMETASLLERPEHGVYALSPLGRSAEPAHRALVSWHRAHFADTGPALAEAERAEDALRRLRGKGAIEVLEALTQYGPLPNGELRAAARLATGTFHYRVNQLKTDQLLTRTSDFSGAKYTLTPAARSLSTVYTELTAFARGSEAVLAPRSGEHSTAAQQTAGTARATAAVRRSPSAFPGLFSHAPDPQPRVPGHITALSRPSRTR
ncbi:winged helix-turn-helix transcriptional regulator [Streptomyces sp. NBC_00075]|uniref:winged helix-turn-helix transcriptional regulator n=1 Tax=Streptomyces sp. NBC_00075 TaxID=2975641 RepID=UPI0032445700